MYKKAIMIVSLLALFGFNANAQWLDFANNDKRLTLGFQLGQAGFGAGESPYGRDYAGFGFGVSLSVMGAYVDCLIKSPEHQYDKHVSSQNDANRYVEDQGTWSVNAGYQIPILPWLRIAPIIGYSQTHYGYTDESSVNIQVDKESSTGRIYHDYKAVDRNHEFNYGGGIFIQPVKWVEVYGVFTRRAIYGGLCLNIAEFGH